MIYFDMAATKPLRKDVLECYLQHLHTFASSSSFHQPGIAAFELFQASLKKIATALKVNPDQLLVTSGASESNNSIINSLLSSARPNKKIITSSVEHPSLLRPLQLAAAAGRCEVVYLDVDERGRINREQLREQLDKNTVLVSIIHVNNETGAINDIAAISKVISDYNLLNRTKILFHADLTQSLTKLPIDFNLLDAASASFHKLGGFKEAGLLYLKKPASFTPLIAGGAQQVGRGGTIDVAKLAANALTIKPPVGESKVQENTAYFIAALSQMEGVLINTPSNNVGGIVNFSVVGKLSQVLVNALQSYGFAVASQASCSSKSDYSRVVLAMFGSRPRAASTLRVSFDGETTRTELAEFVSVLKRVIKEII